jgi:hypothetical protein
MKMMKFDTRYMIGIALAAGLVSAVSLSPASAASSADDSEAQARAAWGETIARTSTPAEGCFQASYPSTEWLKVACTTAPNRPYMPRSGAISLTVGNGLDYAATVSSLISRSVGTFPTVTGVTSEKDGGVANVYSIQLNSNFMSTAACNGISGCLSWQQFVYSSSEQVAFMQYWLINFGSPCPRGWMTFTPDCFKNSRAVSVPQQAISQLANLKLSGSAVTMGTDTLVFTTATQAFSTTGKDTVVDLATDWHASEFNIIGDGGGSKAVFNKGSSVALKIAVTDGSTARPSCGGRHAGTTGETNNLALGSCSGVGGKAPSIAFSESN